MISVIIPLYNKEKTIERTLRSVFSQDYEDFEVVIVDDGSTDSSLEIVEQEYPKIERELGVNVPVSIIKQENGGPSKARNTGLKNAKGDWIVFLDADDEFVCGALKTMHDAINEYKNADIIDFNKYVRRGTIKVLQSHPIKGYVKNPLKELYYLDISPGCGHSVFRASFIEEFPYDERMRRYEDAEILIRMLQQAHVYSVEKATEIHNVDYVSASNPRKSIYEDYLGYLNFKGADFWTTMCLYKIYLGERENYPKECRKLYPSLRYRYDLLLLFKILPLLKFFID